MASLGLSPASHPATLLLVDSDQAISQSLQKNLQHEGYEVLVAGNGSEGVELALRDRPDLVLLEIDLPDMSGFEVCRMLRSQLSLPIVIVSQRAEPVDKVLGLELGADDYLTKPFSWRELLARVHAQLRRVELGRHPYNSFRVNGNDLLTLPASIVVDDLTIQLAERSVRRAGEFILMTPKEFELLAFLVLHPRQVFSRQELLHQVWGHEALTNAKTVDVHVRWLRAKLEQDPANPRLIQTVYGIGYKLTSGN